MRGVGGGEVLEDALAGDAVEGGVVEVEVGDVTARGTRPGACWCRSGVGLRSSIVSLASMPDDGAVGADEAGEGAGDVAGAAADVDEPVAEAGPSSSAAAARSRWMAGIDACSSSAAISAAASGSASTSLKLPRVASLDDGHAPGGVDGPGRRVEQHAVGGLVGGHRGVERVDGSGAAGVVEALEHPAHEAEHEPVGVVGVGAEPHARGRALELDVGEPGAGERRRAPGRGRTSENGPGRRVAGPAGPGRRRARRRSRGSTRCRAAAARSRAPAARPGAGRGRCW